jgi:futalosine hydrolase
MEILVVAAVREEIQPLLDDPELQGLFTPLVAGPGLPAFTYTLARHLARHKTGCLLNAGVCGSFREAWPPGTVVHVTRDMFADLGAEDGEDFLPLTGLGLGAAGGYEAAETPTPGLPALKTLASIPGASAITVHTVHGEEARIARTVRRYDPDIESMEGAAGFYVARREGIPSLQLRAVSNRVERRNREAWELEKAIGNLNAVLKRVVLELAGVYNR